MTTMGLTQLEERQEFDFDSTPNIFLIASTAFLAQLTALFVGLVCATKLVTALNSNQYVYR